ncbi:endonuclease domain-containing 1 protein-like [Channa argus]|uniref:endonuclease domain-containing 1 protein-like n=1 Tax=Channa argus TaxID=215402 RepID=UPI00294746F8|nr:hypothetical protein Q8A73_014523 [Channa argus]
MNLWASLTVALFSVLSFHTQAEVVSSFQSCSQYFYKGKEPRDFDQNAKKICQKMNGIYFFATLYSKHHRIPLYSAYTFNSGCTNQQERKTANWFIEPQLSIDENAAYTNADNMKTDTARESQFIMVGQAINADYSNTGYDRGHLNPNSFMCNDGRVATFTLTNSAPMDACFNRVHWSKWEAGLQMILKEQDPLGTAYLVTGAVPDSSNRIPKQGLFDDPNARDYNRVTVPTYVWTAVCYIHPRDPEENFSFGYIGVNQPHGSIQVKKPEELARRLSVLYRRNNLKIFEDDCVFPNQKRKTEKIVKKLRNDIQLPLSNRLTMSPDVMNTIRTALSHSDDEGTSYSSKRIRLREAKIDVIYDSIDAWFRGMEKLKFVFGFACLRSAPFHGPVISIGHDELRHRRQTSQEVVCSLVPENSDGCSTSCLYNEEAGDYYCSTGSTTIPCSPTYSDVTVSGEKCKSDHTCGKHGYDYYWCNTDHSWDYCSPPPPLGVTKSGKPCRAERNCAKYSESYFWCEPEGGKWEHCCRRADRFSAVNGRTCKQESPCDYYGKSYLWCETTDTTDSYWDYCCTT